MIPRYQKVILWLLLLSSVAMAAYLLRMRSRAQNQLASVPDAAPMRAPVEAPSTSVTLMIASDSDGSLAPVQRQFALPAETTTRARAILNDLAAEYAQTGSPHPLAAIAAVNDVFLLPAPQPAPQSATQGDPGQMAVVNLNGSFADHHPSGIEVETLTLLSMLGTLHANLPQIVQVRFLVDGKPKDTLAGHADLTRVYLTANDVPQVAAPGAAPAQDAAGADAPPAAPSSREGQH